MSQQTGCLGGGGCVKQTTSIKHDRFYQTYDGRTGLSFLGSSLLNDVQSG